MSDLEITPEKIERYCVSHGTAMDPLFQELVETTKKEFPHVYHMQVGALEGNFLSLMVQLMNVKNVLEFGTFTGYSTLAFAKALPEGGKVTTLDRDPKATLVARKFWEKGGVSHKVDLLLGDAKETIRKLESEISIGARPRFDLAFIDADKAGYPFYFEACLKLVKKGGAILTDNVLWSGAVVDPHDDSDHKIHAYNEKLKNDPRVQVVMIPMRDGISLARIK